MLQTGPWTIAGDFVEKFLALTVEFQSLAAPPVGRQGVQMLDDLLDLRARSDHFAECHRIPPRGERIAEPEGLCALVR